MNKYRGPINKDKNRQWLSDQQEFPQSESCCGSATFYVNSYGTYVTPLIANFIYNLIVKSEMVY